MTRIINIFVLLMAFFFLNCSAANMSNEPLKNEAIKECPVCPKITKKKKKCKSKIIYKELAQLVIGEIERAYLPKLGIDLRARIDTGAKTTSIHAENIVPFERDGEKWVRFEIIDKNKKIIKVKRPIKRVVRIKEGEGEWDRRYVVKMRINVSSLTHYGEVNLSDRSSLKYPILIGRNFLKGNAIVDVSRKYTQNPVKEIK